MIRYLFSLRMLARVVMLFWAACLYLLPAQAHATPPKYNLVIIAIDGLRADHMGLYGYFRDTSPHLDARAKTGVVFDHAVSQASWTLPSFTTLFTSRYPEDHGVNSRNMVIPEKYVLLTQVLHDAGYRTAGFVGGQFLDPIYGFLRGFDFYRAGGVGTWRYFSDTVPQAADWIKKNGNKRFFVFLHGNDLHMPFEIFKQGESVSYLYDPGYHGLLASITSDYHFAAVFNRCSCVGASVPMPTKDYLKTVDELRSDPRTIPHLVAQYDEQIHRADSTLELLFQTLRETGHDKDTIVVLMADHGMEWGEKGPITIGYQAALWETVTHVPLVIWHPELGPRRVKDLVQLVDLAPTLLDLLGIKTPSSFKGKSFFGLARGDKSPEERYAFSTSTSIGWNQVQFYSVQNDRWKLIYDVMGNRLSLYDLAHDPGEINEVSAGNPGVLKNLVDHFKEHGIKVPFEH